MPTPNGLSGRSARSLLDWLLILGRGHLDQTMGIYTDHYNRAGPHRGLRLVPPLSKAMLAKPASRTRSVDSTGWTTATPRIRAPRGMTQVLEPFRRARRSRASRDRFCVRRWGRRWVREPGLRACGPGCSTRRASIRTCLGEPGPGIGGENTVPRRAGRGEGRFFWFEVSCPTGVEGTQVQLPAAINIPLKDSICSGLAQGVSL